MKGGLKLLILLLALSFLTPVSLRGQPTAFSDTFDGSSLDTGKWETFGNGTVSVSAGLLTVTNGTEDTGVKAKTSFSTGNFYFRINSTGTNIWGLGYPTSGIAFIMIFADGASGMNVTLSDGVDYENVQIKPETPVGFRTYRIVWTFDSVDVWVNEDKEFTSPISPHTNLTPFIAALASSVEVDWVSVGSYLANATTTTTYVTTVTSTSLATTTATANVTTTSTSTASTTSTSTRTILTTTTYLTQTVTQTDHATRYFTDYVTTRTVQGTVTRYSSETVLATTFYSTVSTVSTVFDLISVTEVTVVTSTTNTTYTNRVPTYTTELEVFSKPVSRDFAVIVASLVTGAISFMAGALLIDKLKLFPKKWKPKPEAPPLPAEESAPEAGPEKVEHEAELPLPPEEPEEEAGGKDWFRKAVKRMRDRMERKGGEEPREGS